MFGLFAKLTSEVIPRSVINISDQLSLDFSSTKHSFRRVRKNPGTPAHLVFLAATHEYGDLLNVNFELDNEATEDLEISMHSWLTGLIESSKQRNSNFELAGSEIVMNKSGDQPLGVLITGTEVIDDKRRDLIKLIIPMTSRHLNDSAIHITASIPVESPQTLKDDLGRIVRSVDVHTDIK